MIPLAAGRPAARTPSSRPPSWGQLFSHQAVWAIVVNNFTFHYAFYVVMNWLPTYFDRVSTARQAQRGSWVAVMPIVGALLVVH